MTRTTGRRERPLEEAILPLPGPRSTIASARAFRSTWILSSLESLRLGGYWERYLDELVDHREQILSCVAGAWLPMNVARAHYRACDRLRLSNQEITGLGASEGGPVRLAWRSAFVALAGRAVSVPEALRQVHRMWHRSADGGAAAVYLLDKCHARVEYVGCELFEITFFRLAVRAALVRLLAPLGIRTAVRELPQPAGDECHFAVRWNAETTGR